MTFLFVLIIVYDPDPLDPQDFAFLDPDPQNYTDPGPRGKISTKNCKKNFFTLKIQIWTVETSVSDPYHLVGSGSVSGNVDMDPGSAKN